MAHKNRSGAGPTAPGAKTVTAGDSNANSKQPTQEQGRVSPDALLPDLAETKRFLAELAPGTESFTFQTFDDNADRKRGALVKKLHGTLANHGEELVRLNTAGAGIFVTVNVTDLKGRETKNITQVRAAFSDLDGAPLHPVLAAKPLAHIVVESSFKRWHAYWRTFGVELDGFRKLQKMLAAHFGGDKSVHDLPRVMRLPGFIHHKVKGGVASPPFRSRIVNVNPGPLATAEALRAMCAPTATVVRGLDDEFEAMMEREAGKGLDLTTEDALPPLTIPVAKAALKVINPDLPEPEWFEIGSVLGNEFGDEVGFKLWAEWSTSRGEKHKLNEPGYLEEKWRHIKSKNYSFRAGTLIYYADLTDPNWRDNVPDEDGGGPQTADHNTASGAPGLQTITMNLATLLWGSGTHFVEGQINQFQFGGGSKVLEFTRRGPQWFDFTAMRGGNTRDLMRLAEASAPAPSVALQATPFTLRDHKQIPPRDWVYDQHYIKGFLSTTIAPGGGGKTSLLLAECVALASGKNLLGPTVRKKYRVWYWNGEEPLVELERRVAAICLHHNITQADIAGYLFLNSGREPDSKIIMAEERERGRTFKVAIPYVEAIKRTVEANKIDVMVIDPFIRTHAVSENDNQRINAVADVWSTIAYDMQCAIDAGHHTRKGSAKERGEYTADDSRGASALVNAARSARVLNQMTEDEALRAQVKVSTRKRYFRVINDKANMAPPPENSQWYKYESVLLGNATADHAADNMGVVIQFVWPQPMEVNVEIVHAIQEVFAQGNARADGQAGEKWGGHIVAQHLAINLEGGEPEDQKAARHRVKALLKQWVTNGWLGIEDKLDAHRKPRKFYKVGQWASRASDPNRDREGI